MEEKQIEREVPAADLHRVLGTDEAEITPHFNDELSEILQQTPMQIGLRMTIRKTQELDDVGILEEIRRRRMSLNQRSRGLGRVEHRTFKEGGTELTFELPRAPSLPHCQTHIEFTLFGALALAQDDEVVGPGQLSHQ